MLRSYLRFIIEVRSPLWWSS